LRRAAWTLAAAAALPHVLLLLYRVVPPPVTPLMIIRLADGDGFDRDWVGFGDIAPALARAAIAAEDNRFCQHGGVDWQELRSVIWEDRSDDRMRGASTITMQTVKNLVLWPGRDVVRKGLEIYLASYLDLIWPKRRILEVYLNVAEWGPGVYGAEAAAIRYFNKPARQLTRREAALLAAVLPNPRRWRPDRPTRYIAGRADTIERRAEGMGALLACAV
jgi:monofunctional biosynthetic peptidoglycan transglycosylase